MWKALGETTACWLTLAVFWVMQLGVNASFKWGAMGRGAAKRRRTTAGFVLGNAISFASMLFVMQLYAHMNPNVALALIMGGAFLVTQLGLAWLFHSRPKPLHWVGYLVVAAGMGMASA